MGSWRKVGAFLGLVPDEGRRDEFGDDYQDAALKGLFRRFFAGRADTFIEFPWAQVMIVCSGASA